MGHGDLLAIADAGLPVPIDVERIDLAVAPGVPALLDVVDAVLSELRVETYLLAEESKAACPNLVQALSDRLPGIEVQWVDHVRLKALTHEARAIVRTGEFTSYANLLLVSGVDFSRS
jgi:D-ribose pyranase